MKIKIPVTLLKVENKEGISKKTSQKYSIYTAHVVDKDGEFYKMNVSDKCVEAETPSKLLELKNQEVTAEISVRPKGYDLSGTIVGMEW